MPWLSMVGSSSNLLSLQFPLALGQGAPMHPVAGRIGIRLKEGLHKGWAGGHVSGAMEKEFLSRNLSAGRMQVGSRRGSGWAAVHHFCLSPDSWD
jgi:hypothetical protein